MPGDWLRRRGGRRLLDVTPAELMRLKTRTRAADRAQERPILRDRHGICRYSIWRISRRRRQMRIVGAIVAGGLIAGTLDILAATILFGLKGAPPITVFQSVASGLLGRSAYQGGLAAAALGGALHFFIALVAAAVFVAASLALPSLRSQPIRWGAAFGIAMYVAMNGLVVPLSAATPKPQFSIAMVVIGLIIHVILVGLPIALIASRVIGREARPSSCARPAWNDRQRESA
jgi:hypothetical protein